MAAQSSVSFLLVLLLSFVLPPSALADPGPLKIYLTAGPAFPAAPGNFTSNWQLGFGFGVEAGYRFAPVPGLEIVGTMTHESFDFDHAGPAARDLRDELGEFIADGGTMTSIAWGGGLRLTSELGQRIHPYVSVLANYHRVHIQEQHIMMEDEHQIEPSRRAFGLGFTISAGLGVSVLPTVQLLVEPRYAIVSVEPDRIQYLPVRFGIIFQPGS